jgi:hypothetical protein
MASDETPGALVPSGPVGVVLDDYSGVEISPAARGRLERTILAGRLGGVYLSPMICRGGNQCPFVERCPIGVEDGLGGNFPVGKQCIVEVNLINNRFVEYIEELDIEGEIERSPTLRSLVSKLVELDIEDYRLSLTLSGLAHDSDGTLLLKQVTMVNNVGDEVETLAEHPAWRMKERIQKQRMEILDAIVATPKRKAMVTALTKGALTENAVSRTFDLLEKVSRIERLLHEGE